MNFQMNLNGNTPDDIRKHLIAVGDAAQALEKAIVALRAEVFHGRNYQTLEGGEALRHQDVLASCQHQSSARAAFDWAARGMGDLIKQREGL